MEQNYITGKSVDEEVIDRQFDLQEDVFDRQFKPRGAIAFFVLLVILGLIIWFGIYFLMLARV